jgi:hypothetical protein
MAMVLTKGGASCGRISFVCLDETWEQGNTLSERLSIVRKRVCGLKLATELLGRSQCLDILWLRFAAVRMQESRFLMLLRTWNFRLLCLCDV